MTILVTDEELPTVGAPAPRSQVVVGTAVAVLAFSMLLGGMLAVWLLKREIVVGSGERFPLKYVITEVASNVMLMVVWMATFLAGWAWYSGREHDRAHTVTALGLVALMGVAFINAQAFVWYTMDVPVAADYYGPLFYAVTGMMVALVAIGMVYSVVAAFRTLASRPGGTGILEGHALYSLFIALAYSAVWFVVYVTK